MTPPLIPPGLKLRDRKMSFDGDEFFQVMAGASSAAKVAALHLIWRSWRESPTGTIPNDDDRLREASAADGKTWKRVRAKALRPFILCDDGRYHCHLLVGHLADICRHRARKSQGVWRQMSDYFAANSIDYGVYGGAMGSPNVPTRPDSSFPSNLESVLHPRAREADRPDPTPTRPKNAGQDHEAHGEAPLPDDWQPAPSDVEAVRAERPDLDDIAIERQRKRFVRRSRGLVATMGEWSRRFVAFAKGGHAKPFATSRPLHTPQSTSKGGDQSGESPEISQWRARLRGWKPGALWLPNWGPRPGEAGCHVPKQLLAEFGLLPPSAG